MHDDAIIEYLPSVVEYTMRQISQLRQMSGAEKKAWTIDLISELLRHLVLMNNAPKEILLSLMFLPSIIDKFCDIESGEVSINKAGKAVCRCF
jgi:hypothetical protein